jgi:hypothetical protein
MKRGRAKSFDIVIFVSYAHADPPLFRQMLESILKGPGVQVRLWTDHEIMPGSVPDKEIRAALEQMDIFVALISPLFAASRYIDEVEVPIAKKRRRLGEIEIAPVVIEHPGDAECEWLMDLEPLPDKKKSWSDIRQECRADHGEYDKAIRPLRDGIKKLVDRVRGRRGGAAVRA